MTKGVLKSFITLMMLSFSVNSIADTCLKIGLLGEFKKPTGSFDQPFGNEIRLGSEIALERIKQNNKNTCITFEQIDINNTISNIDGLIRYHSKNGIVIFIGLGISDQALAAQNALIATNTILISPTASSTDLLSEDSRTILLFPTNDMIADKLTDHLSKLKPTNVLSIFASNSKYSTNMNKLFTSKFKSKGGQITSIEIRSNNFEMTPIIKKIKSDSVKYVFLPLYEIEAAKIISELKNNKLDPVFVGADSWGTHSSVISGLTVGQQYTTIIPVIYDYENNSKLNKYFTLKYSEQRNKSPSDLAAFSFDAVNLAQLIQTNCSLKNLNSKKQISLCLSKLLPFDSTTGSIKSIAGLTIQRNIQIKNKSIGFAK
jgi:ABC-type branched-subunit amino acid transport system substrate-binding protein